MEHDADTIAASIAAYGDLDSFFGAGGLDDDWLQPLVQLLEEAEAVPASSGDHSTEAALPSQSGTPPAIKQDTTTGSNESGERRKRKQRTGSPTNHIASPQIDTKQALLEMEQEVEQKARVVHILSLQHHLLSARCTMLERLVKARNDQQERLMYVQQHGADHVLQQIGLTTQQLRSMKLQEVAMKIRDLSQELGQLLLQYTLHGDIQPLQQYIKPLREVIKYATLLRPDYLLFSAHNVNELCDFMDGATVAPEGHWSGVVDNMELSAEQVEAAWVLLELYRGWHRRLMHERATTSAALAQVLEVQKYGQVYHDPSSGSALTETQIIDRLQANIVKERCLLVLLGEVFAEVLTDKQIAQSMVHSYPYMPDDIALLTAVAARHTPITLPPAVMAAAAAAAPPPAGPQPAAAAV